MNRHANEIKGSGRDKRGRKRKNGSKKSTKGKGSIFFAIERLKPKAGDTKSNVHLGADPSTRPKLPVYRVAEIASYFTRFERVSSRLKINANDYAFYLGSLLTGKLAEFNTSSSPDVTEDYSQIKAAILRLFHRTSDH